MDLFEKMQILKKLYDYILNDVAKEFSMTLNDLKVLEFISVHNKDNLAKCIVDECLIAKSHVSLSVKNLENAGLLIKVQDDFDKKKIHLIPTKKANPILDVIDKKKKYIKKCAFAEIPNDEIETMEQVIKNVYINVKKILDKKETQSV